MLIEQAVGMFVRLAEDPATSSSMICCMYSEWSAARTSRGRGTDARSSSGTNGTDPLADPPLGHHLADEASGLLEVLQLPVLRSS